MFVKCLCKKKKKKKTDYKYRSFKIFELSCRAAYIRLARVYERQSITPRFKHSLDNQPVSFIIYIILAVLDQISYKRITSLPASSTGKHHVSIMHPSLISKFEIIKLKGMQSLNPGYPIV